MIFHSWKANVVKMESIMLLDRDKSSLLVIDVQEKLTPLVLNADALIARCGWVIRLANDLQVPVVLSEQYPRGLGRTVTPLLTDLEKNSPIQKVCFSCFKEPSFVDAWKKIQRTQAVLIGIETHVCVLQTAIDLVNAGVAVFVVVDAVSSRHELDHRYGLKRMKQAGVQLVTAEMVFFEWLGEAGTPEFKTLSQTYLR